MPIRTTRMRRAMLLPVAALALAATLLDGTPAFAATPGTWSDFDKDGWSDLAVGIAYADVQGVDRSGAVIVFYGSATGVTSANSKIWNADTVLATESDVEENARFGQSLAAGDFDKDGYGDLAIGAPGADVYGAEDAGKVYVLFGSTSGLTAARTHTWASNSVVEYGQAGWSLVALDWFDFVGETQYGDGFADLAIGAPFYDDHGRVSIVPGQRFANPPNGQVATFDGTHLNGRFGWALAAGDFNDTDPGRGKGLDDLAIGAPRASPGGQVFTGNVEVVQRGAIGIVQRTAYDQDTGTIPDISEPHDNFGSALAAGDLDGDGFDDLAVGVENEDVFVTVSDTAQDAGIVIVLQSDPDGDGLQAAGRRLRQGTVGIGGWPEDSDHFGRALAIADFGGQSPRRDLAIGIPGEPVNGHDEAGAVAVVDNDGSGLDVGSTVMWSQASTGIGGAPEPGDLFGSELTAGQYGRGTRLDLVVAATGEGIVPSAGGAVVPGAGQIHLIYGKSAGLSAANSQVWNVDSPGVPWNLRSGDAFGAALR